ncbi:hypothetical protein [Brevibacterium sp.]|uniref:hypothetical protein n=1 Tax=Brevibacterium sp. TaxID=1701 RepID=UPI00281217A7|nr:hypothetical protein [Brevibacterium sp.]
MTIYLDSSFKEEVVESSYTVLDAKSMTIKSGLKILLRAVKPQRFYIRQYYWSSSGGVEKPPIVKSGRDVNGTRRHKLLRPVVESTSGGRFAVVDLGRIILPDETEEIEFETFLISVNPKSPSHLGHVAKDGCEKIVLRAVVPKEIIRGRVLQRVWLPNADDSSADLVAQVDSEPPEHVPDPRRWVSYTYSIDNPKPGNRYRLQWDH